MAPRVLGEAQRPLRSGVSRSPVDTAPRVLGEGQGPRCGRGKQEPHGHSPMCPGRRTGPPLSFLSSLSTVSSRSSILLSVKADDGRMPDQLAVNGVRRSGDVESEWHQWLLF